MSLLHSQNILIMAKLRKEKRNIVVMLVCVLLCIETLYNVHLGPQDSAHCIDCDPKCSL